MSEIKNIIPKIISGDNKEFEKTIDLYEKKIFKYCYYMLGNSEDSKNTTQKIFIFIYRKLNTYKKILIFKHEYIKLHTINNDLIFYSLFYKSRNNLLNFYSYKDSMTLRYQIDNTTYVSIIYNGSNNLITPSQHESNKFITVKNFSDIDFNNNMFTAYSSNDNTKCIVVNLYNNDEEEPDLSIAKNHLQLIEIGSNTSLYFEQNKDCNPIAKKDNEGNTIFENVGGRKHVIWFNEET